MRNWTICRCTGPTSGQTPGRNRIGKICLLLPVIHLLLTIGGLDAKAFGQKEMSNWFFGYNAGLDFSTGAPVFQTGSLRNWEGCSSISDRYGNLLFYTDGMTVWDRLHRVMPNGAGLKGDTMSTQSALITPCPGNESLYYIFTADAEAGRDGLQYSLLDTRLNGGFGDITSKNIPLLSPVCEKIAAVRHKNGNDIWLITHQFGTDGLYVYLISCSGISTAPLVFHTGMVIDKISNTIGYLKVSPDGSKIAMANFTSRVGLFDFDDFTGTASNPRQIFSNPNNICGPYGVEFSADSKILYESESYNCNGSGAYYIFQYRMDVTDIIGSKMAIDSGYSGSAGALQRGPDNKIYIAYDGMSYLGAVTEPEIYGPGCKLVKQYLTFPATARNGVGLPSFLSGYDKTLLQKDTGICPGDTAVLRITLPGTQITWQDGTNADSFVMRTPGIYWAMIDDGRCLYRDSVTLALNSPPIFSLGRDTVLCPDMELLLDVSYAGDSFLWQDGSTATVYRADKAGAYSVTVTKDHCSASDTIAVTYMTLPQPHLGNDTTLCAGQELLLDPGAKGTSWLWQDGSRDSVYRAAGPGLYSVSVGNECGLANDEILVQDGGCRIVFPNAFTPDRPQNNIFHILNGHGLKDYGLRIYNRRGQLLYETLNISDGWNGRCSGMPQPEGVYVYLASYANPSSGRPEFQKGTFILIR